ncbi:MAG: GNAT family N-acetyltransferase [Ferruginibacter sp.]
MTYRAATSEDLKRLQQLAILSWSRFKDVLTADNWQKLYSNISNVNTYTTLLEQSECIVCIAAEQVIGMAFLMSSGNPTDIYEAGWCSIRFVTVHPHHNGKGIGKKLTQLCIEKATKNGEKTIALHTSEFMNNARHIYESLGFTVLKEIPPRFDKKYWLYTLEI